eukprot:CAMPEP_0170618988 /NCGR_PEP_ID=MMETSP0224-20130122/27267_1 /TAXON_ID=285029 /ORGANISM="Togula jolla, Strain CCCM 725" /LENGTH=198 /DNA_ID=CAMNT_0010945029 /DNA_START=66 /DNA_END=663 /DNA_ORIENTATION=+
MIFTIFATIDSLTLLFAITGLVGSSGCLLKNIADLEHDLVNSVDFMRNMTTWALVEYVFLFINVAALLPFLGSWWMAVPQLMWAAIKIMRSLSGGGKMDEREIYKSKVYLKHRRFHMTGFLFYLCSWFIYFVRAMCAIMDIHVHGISPYDEDSTRSSLCYRVAAQGSAERQRHGAPLRVTRPLSLPCRPGRLIVALQM